MTTSNKLTKKELNQVFWRSFGMEWDWNYERQMNMAYCYCMLPVIKKLYSNKEDQIAAMQRHLEFFNTTPQLSTLILGISAAMEESNANNPDFDTESINSVKVSLMGPLAGIGDSVVQGIVATIPLAIFVPMAQQGSVLAAFIPGLIYIAWSYFWSWTLFNKGYTLGKNSVLEILHSGAIKKVIDIASIVGLFMIGCLSASYVKVSTILEFASGADGATTTVQSILDGILPNMLPFVVVMSMYLYITKRGPKFIRLMVYTMVIAVVLTFFHII